MSPDRVAGSTPCGFHRDASRVRTPARPSRGMPLVLKGASFRHEVDVQAVRPQGHKLFASR